MSKIGVFLGVIFWKIFFMIIISYIRNLFLVDKG